MGLIDKVLDKNHNIFTAQIKHLANHYVNDKALFQKTLTEKAETRCFDEAKKALATYRQFELTQMHSNFYSNDEYQQARKNFVYKISDNITPKNIALHRQKEHLSNKPVTDTIRHFSWNSQYEMDNEMIDKQHKNLLGLAEKMLDSGVKDGLIKSNKLIFQHVKEHFSVEEALMKKFDYQHYLQH